MLARALALALAATVVGCGGGRDGDLAEAGRLTASNGPTTTAPGTRFVVDARVVRPPLGEEFTLAPREVAEVDGADLDITFVGVSADSRCPAGVSCVWAGDATVELSVVVRNRATGRPPSGVTAELHTGTGLATTATVGPFAVALTRLTPAPSPDGVSPGRYRAVLRVTPA
ncbi:hypothetical protein FraQA3DRAFT_1524 [Frankia sp. QA3]|nr:hypothetical protein FraQA3DRAFT_1524 [Frankia sp. QA3]